MLSVIIIVALLAALLFVIGAYTSLAHTLESTRRTSSRLIHQRVLEINDLNAAVKTLKNSNEAWERGIDEQQEIYEMQMLSLNEILVEKNVTLEKLREDLRIANAKVRLHERIGLPILDFDQLLVHELEAMGEDYDVEAILRESSE